MTSSEAEGMRGCFEVERRSVDKCRRCRDADAKMTIALLDANVAGERISAWLGLAWLGLAVRACKTTLPQESEEQARQS